MMRKNDMGIRCCPASDRRCKPLIDSYTTSLAAEVAYIVVLLAILAWLVFYLKTKCVKK